MSVSRRTFVRGLAAGSALIAAGGWRALAHGRPTVQQVLRGTSFDLAIDDAPVNFTGAPRIAHTINGSIPGPLLRWREGDTVTLRVANHLRDHDTSIHWHGIVLPAEMDGVPGLSFHGIRPGETYTYRFDVRQSGTYWYHSHSGFQEQRGVYGPLVIEPLGDDPIKADREHVILLSDWTDEDPERVFAKLKKQSSYYNVHKRTVADFFRDAGRNGFGATVAERSMWGSMRMNPTVLAYVCG
jgi:CopA family copper-resistance protein